MAIYRTGRDLTLTCTGSLSGTIAQLFGPGGSTRCILSASAFGCSIGGILTGDGPRPDPTLPDKFWQNWQVSASAFGVSDTEYWTLAFPMYFGQDDPPLHTWDVGGSYSISVDVEEVVEISGIPYGPGSLGAPIDAPFGTKARIYLRGRPGGQAVSTVSSGGATATATYTFPLSGGGEVDLGVSATAAAETCGRSQYWYVYEGETLYASLNTYAGTGCNASVSVSHSLGLPGTSYSYAAQNSSVNCSGGAIATVSVPPVWDDYYYVEEDRHVHPSTLVYVNASASYSAHPPKPVGYDIGLLAMDVPYPAPLAIDCPLIKEGPGQSDPARIVAVNGGSVGRSYTQQRYSVSGSTNGESHPVLSKDEFAPLMASIMGSSLSGQREDPRQTRILLRGWLWDALTLSQAPEVVLDDGSSLTPTLAHWTGTWTAQDDPDTAPPLTVVDATQAGNIEFTAAPQGRVVRGFAHDVSLSGYRYLRLRMKASAAQAPVSLMLGGKFYRFRTAGTEDWTDIDVDLCAEHIAAPDGDDSPPPLVVSDFDSKWPVAHNNPAEDASPTPPPPADALPLNEGALFGVGRCPEIVFSGLTPGVTYHVAEIKLVRKQRSRVTFLPPFYRGRWTTAPSGSETLDEHWPTQRYPSHSFGTLEGGMSQYYARRFLLGETDGRQSLEEEDSSYVYNIPPFGPSTVHPSGQSISGLVASVNGVNPYGTVLNPGWTAADLRPAPADGTCDGSGMSLPALHACFLSGDAPASYLFGAGAVWDGSWRLGFDADAAQAATFPAQALFDSVDWWPGCQDVFFNAGFSGGTVLHGLAFLRGAAHGTVLDPGQDRPQSGAGVTLTDVSEDDPPPGVPAGVFAGVRPAGGGVTDALGWYATHAPYMRGGVYSLTFPATDPEAPPITLDITAQGRTSIDGTEPIAEIVRPHYARKRHRASFLTPVSLPPPDCPGLLFDTPVYFPFPLQFTDPAALPYEERRLQPSRAPVAGGDQPGGTDANGPHFPTHPSMVRP